jgi:hypothetical protein
MDQGTQEKVRPAYSYADKSRIVSAFVKSRFKVNTYYQVSNILNQGFLSPLENLPFIIRPAYTTEEGEKYFRWLVAVCSGAVQISEERLRTATEHLFTFLQFMKHDITIDKDPFYSPPLDVKLDIISKQISDLYYSSADREKKFLEIFEIIKTWIHTYKEPLEQAKEYFAGKVKKPEGNE